MPRRRSYSTDRILYCLWFAPWASAGDLADMTGLDRLNPKYLRLINNVLARERRQGRLYRERLGRYFQAVERHIFTPEGLDYYSQRYYWPLHWWHTNPGALLARLQMLEITYTICGRLFQSNALQESACWVIQETPGLSERTGEPVTYVAATQEDWRRAVLTSFYWFDTGPFDAVAVYVDGQARGHTLYLPILWRGRYPRAGDMARLPQDLSEMLEQDYRWVQAVESTYRAHDPSILVLTPDLAAAGMAQRRWLDGLPRGAGGTHAGFVSYRGRGHVSPDAPPEAHSDVLRALPAPTAKWSGIKRPAAPAGSLGDLEQWLGTRDKNRDKNRDLVVNTRGGWAVEDALVTAPGATEADIAALTGLSVSRVLSLLRPMERAKIRSQVAVKLETGHYPGQAGRRITADAERVTRVRVFKRFRALLKGTGKYRRQQHRHTRGLIRLVVALRRSGYQAYLGLGLVINYGNGQRVSPDAYVVIDGMLVAIEYERSAVKDKKVAKKIGSYQRLAQIGPLTPVLFVTEKEEGAINFANTGISGLLATTVERLEQGPLGQTTIADGRRIVERGCWGYNEQSGTHPDFNKPVDFDKPIDMWVKHEGYRSLYDRWLLPHMRQLSLG